VILPNIGYGCDYFVHYYEIAQEESGRSGAGGSIHFEDIKLLRQAVHAAARATHTRLPHVGFAADTGATFAEQHAALLRRIRTERDAAGRPRIYPWRAGTYTPYTTTDNIVKMWHTIHTAWETMRAHAAARGFAYARVAMLRNDVVYVTPIDIYAVGPGRTDAGNRVAVVPGFGRHPIR